MNVNEAAKTLGYPVDEAISDAARWIEGQTMYGGMRGWRPACAVLACEVQLLRLKLRAALDAEERAWERLCAIEDANQQPNARV